MISQPKPTEAHHLQDVQPEPNTRGMFMTVRGKKLKVKYDDRVKAYIPKGPVQNEQYDTEKQRYYIMRNDRRLYVAWDRRVEAWVADPHLPYG